MGPCTLVGWALHRRGDLAPHHPPAKAKDARRLEVLEGQVLGTARLTAEGGAECGGCSAESLLLLPLTPPCGPGSGWGKWDPPRPPRAQSGAASPYWGWASWALRCGAVSLVSAHSSQ